MMKIYKILFTTTFVTLVFSGCSQTSYDIGSNGLSSNKKSDSSKKLSWSFPKPTTVFYFGQTLDIPDGVDTKKDRGAKKNVVLHNLKTRADKQANEDLIREVAIKDPSLFRIIQKESKNLNIDKISLANLPQDVSVSYALNNYAKIIKTGRYLATNGKFKTYTTNQIKFDSDLDYKSTTKVSVNGNEVEMKKDDKKPKNNDFIDFSDGL